MKTHLLTLILFAGFLFGSFSASVAQAHDPDLDYILNAVESAPCSGIQVIIARNIGSIRWPGGNLRFLYRDDIMPLKEAMLESGKRVIQVNRRFKIPNLKDPNWMQVEDRLDAALNRIYDRDYRNHPPNGC